jgi:hypothetical protein|tara:strand:- start:15 stop:272 length:258 start_codon:yes stop_codon:yes gene_type:complete
MPKIIDEATQIGVVKLSDGREIPRIKCRSETTIINLKTKKEYSSEEEVQADIANPNTETTEKDIQRNVQVFAPSLADMLGVTKKT